MNGDDALKRETGEERSADRQLLVARSRCAELEAERRRLGRVVLLLIALVLGLLIYGGIVYSSRTPAAGEGSAGTAPAGGGATDGSATDGGSRGEVATGGVPDEGETAVLIALYEKGYADLQEDIAKLNSRIKGLEKCLRVETAKRRAHGARADRLLKENGARRREADAREGELMRLRNLVER